ncbi:YceK/YidQ family lipoprotein [Pseudomonas promysalinigenes]|uniref:YceK/YidQ family lipoprotein n=1 Tax=Pseudomonas promysalinigenes TaxID=485898 RepID=A0ABY6AGX9_9PSED|nr:YceK/YidQ family lipoprotein [Pseudomonas promysalinigenes]UXH38167.1 YceK/YidQ family lipoprotein [Pseudomonas promysalinigenes]
MSRYGVALVALSLLLTGCGTINTVFSSDEQTAQGLASAQTRCEALPRVYSGVFYNLCILHGPPQVAEQVPGAPAGIPLRLIDFIPSGVFDTLLLPYTISVQATEGSLEL